MQVKTEEATKLQLDYGLAKVMGAKRIIVNWRGVWVEDEGFKVGDDCRGWVCHTDPAVCMGLIEQYKMDVTWGTSGKIFVQMSDSDDDEWHGGKTLAQAVARCVISMRLGDEFECLSELCQIECWSCGHTMTMEQRSTNDGHCVKCNAEIEMPDELGVQS